MRINNKELFLDSYIIIQLLISKLEHEGFNLKDCDRIFSSIYKQPSFSKKIGQTLDFLVTEGNLSKQEILSYFADKEYNNNGL